MAKHQAQLFGHITDQLENNDQTALKAILTDQRSSDIAEVIELLDNDQRRIIFDLLEKPISAEVLEKVDEATRAELFDLFGEAELTKLISELDPDDAADVLAELPEEESEEVLERMPDADADQIKDLMSYSEDSAGGIMDPVVVSVQEDGTVRQAINMIQESELDEDFFGVFVVNKTGKFLGDVRIRALITNREDVRINQLVNTETIYVKADTDQEEVRNIFSKNDLIVVPVLDAEDRLVGRITADRVIEVAEEEAAEDMYAMAGTDAAELENFSIVHAARVRMTWLLPCLAGTAITAIVILVSKGIFSDADQLAVWATAMVFTPMIAAISGNAGLQTSAIVVCGLATGDLAALKLGQVFVREVRVALLVALSCGVIGGLICIFVPYLMNSNGFAEAGRSMAQINFSEHLYVVYAFATAMFSAIMVATTLGLSLPFVFRRIGIDPAISSGPLVTTANDAISVAIYMSLTLLLT